MYRPTGFADLAGRRVGIFGYGLEGRASEARARAAGAEVVVVDDADVAGALRSDAGGHEALLACEVVLKSPGIPRRRDDVIDLESRGVVVTSALNLWLHEAPRERVVAVTGTKGKSTTTSLITFFLACLGESAQSLGNIGQPPYDPAVDTTRGWSVVEVSSFQCVDLDRAPATVVVTSIGSDHLDWHGSLDQYVEDKLSITRAPGIHQTFVPDARAFHELADRLGNDVIYVAADATDLAARLGLIGAHNDANVGLALATVSALLGREPTEVVAAIVARASEFTPLRGRLTPVGRREVDGGSILFVDDGLATSPLPTVAALAVFAAEPLALIAGGFDRGVDYQTLVGALAARTAPTRVVAIGPAGARIAVALRKAAPHVEVVEAATMPEAVERGGSFLDHGGVVLLSPGAPSFDAYRNWEERSEAFTSAAREWSLGRDSNP